MNKSYRSTSFDFSPRRFRNAGFYLLVLGGIFCLVVVSGVGAAENMAAKRVLILSTGSRFAPGFALAEQSALDTLRKLGAGEIEVYSESLDIVKFPNERYRRLFRAYLHEKYAESPPISCCYFMAATLAPPGNRSSNFSRRFLSSSQA